MGRWKKYGRFFCSMKCAVILLVTLAVACTAGSLVPQMQETQYYLMNYPKMVSGLILMMNLDDMFHSWWFAALTLLLCINLICCNVLHFPRLMKRMRTEYRPEQAIGAWDGTELAVLCGKPEKLFARMGFRKPEKITLPDQRSFWYASKNQIGMWGAWLCHVSMLVIILGFVLGQLFQSVDTVYGVPGQKKSIGQSVYSLQIDDFDIRLRPDDTVEQYTAALTVTRETDGVSRSGTASVNAPLSLFGMKLYQNSTGWAATLDVYKGEEKLQEELLCAGEFARVKDQPELAVALTAFYPDVAEDANGHPVTVSAALRNPGYLYTLYYQDHILGMNLLKDQQKITVEDYTLVFRDPQPYTLIQIKRDPFTWLTAAGGIAMMISLILTFYIRPARLWMIEKTDGTWSVAGSCRKGGSMFVQELVHNCDRIKGEMTDES